MIPLLIWRATFLAYSSVAQLTFLLVSPLITPTECIMLNRSSPLRVEINPWTLDSTLHEVMQLRGAYVAAWGTIETRLTELAIRASKHEKYSSIRASFPSRRPDRLKFLEAVCTAEGPLKPFVGLIAAAVQRFRAGLELRDMLAHARMQVLSGPGDGATITLKGYTAAGDSIASRNGLHSLRDLRETTYRATRLSRCVDCLYGRIGQLLPELSDNEV